MEVRMLCRRTLAATVLLSVLAAGAWAREQPCTQDREKFCKDIRSGGPRLMRCLQEHAAELSVPCQQRLAGLQKRRQRALRACQGDIDRLCASAPQNRRALVECLRSHEAKLSEGCKKVVQRRDVTPQPTPAP